MGAGESNIISSSVGVEPGVGDVTSNCTQNADLCGRGDTSMCSIIGAGDDEGSGGVVTKPMTVSDRPPGGMQNSCTST